MRVTIVTTYMLATLAAAQSRESLPVCSLSCLDESTALNSNCAADNFGCICSKFNVIQGAATGCIMRACGSEVALGQFLPAIVEICRTVDTSGFDDTKYFPELKRSLSITVFPPESPSITVFPPESPSITVFPLEPENTATEPITKSKSSGSVETPNPTSSTVSPPLVTGGAFRPRLVDSWVVLLIGALLLW